MNRPRITPSVIPNLFTSLNMFCGFLSILYASEGNYNYSAWLIFVASIFDVLDGMVARFTNSSSDIGVELDSLADVISFGAAPSFLFYKTYFYQFDIWGIILSSLPLIAGGFRLARFNVQLVGFEKSFFIGLPIPSAGLTIASFILAFFDNGFAEPFNNFPIPMVLILAFLMVSNVRYDTLPKFTIKNIKENPLPVILITAGIVLFIITYTKGLFLIFVFLVLFGIFKYIFRKLFAGSEH